MKKSEKTEKIVDCTLALLKSKGDGGVTMRQVAVQAGMSLSNVQYYFKTKDDLLKALADRYFAQCLEDMRGIEAITSTTNGEAEVEVLLKKFLDYGLEISEMCLIFREYWAIATRNSVIETYLIDYYRSLAKHLADKLRPLAANEQALSQAVSFIVPFTEGYSITARAVPCDVDEMTTLVTVTVMRLLRGE